MRNRKFPIQIWLAIWYYAMPSLFSVARAAEISKFQAGDGGWQMGTMAVGNIDSDPQLEIIVPYRNSNGLWFLDAFKYNGSRVTGFPHAALFDPINVSPTLYDLDRDGKNEIIITQGAKVVALRGDGSVLWSKAVNSLNYVPDGGFMAVTNGFYMSFTGLFQPTLPPTSEFFSEVSSPLVADLDGDGKPELLTAWKIDPDSLTGNQDYNPFINDLFGLSEWGASGEVWSGGVVVMDAATGNKKFNYHFHQLVEAGLALGRPEPGSAIHTYVLNDADSVAAFDLTKPPGLFGSGMLHKMFGKNLRLLSGTYQRGVDIYTCDFDGDGRDEVLAASSQIDPNWQPSETAIDDDGAILWREWKQPFNVGNQFGWFNSACMIPVNPDHDNHIDVLSFTTSQELQYRYWDGVKFVSHAGWPKNFAPYMPTPPVVGDVDGDGQEEIVVGTYDPLRNPSSGHLYVFALDGTQKVKMAVPGGIKHIPALANIRGQGALDVIYRALDGKVYVQNFGAQSSSLVSWATHRGNMARDGNFGRQLFPPGTPIVPTRESGYRRTAFNWRLPAGFTATSMQIYRADVSSGPFQLIATLPGGTTHFEDANLTQGWLYFYEVAAVYGGGVVHSSPFSILAAANHNLIANGGFEEDDNSHWDKWFSGDISWNDMVASPVSPHQGRQSMEIRLRNQGNNSSITQYSHYALPRDYLAVQEGILYSFGGWFRNGGLTQPSSHWFEWDTSKTAEHTNNRPGLPWPNYFTPAANFGTSPGQWLYSNRVFEMPPNFFNTQLRHRMSAAPQQTTGSIYIDDVFFRALPSLQDPTWQALLGFGSTWRYWTTTPPSDWFAAGFNDAAWPQAKAKFGQGTGPQNIVTPLPARKSAYYFRRQFTVASPNLEEFLLSAYCTDDYASVVYPMRIWLNGTELTTTGIEAVSGQGNVIKYYDMNPFIPLLKAGVNSIAVQLNNTWQPDWDDVAFDISLRGIQAPSASPVRARFAFARREKTGSISVGSTGPVGTTWRLESTDVTSASLVWQALQNITYPNDQVLTVVDSGQNGRLPPSQIKARLYRLVEVP